MDQGVLVIERIAAGAEFVRELNDQIPVSVACWVIPAESDNQFLYIASDDIDDANIRESYREAACAYQAARSPWLDLFQIKLINTSDPIAQDAIEFRDQFGSTVGTYFRGSSIGGIGIDRAYIYPPVAALLPVS